MNLATRAYFHRKFVTYIVLTETLLTKVTALAASFDPRISIYSFFCVVCPYFMYYECGDIYFSPNYWFICQRRKSDLSPFLRRTTKDSPTATPYLPFVRGIHRLPVDSPHKFPVMWKVFSCHVVFMQLRINRKYGSVDLRVKRQPNWSEQWTQCYPR